MNSSIIQNSLSRGSCFGQKLFAVRIVTVRNHVKMYPWRQSRSNAICYLDTTKTPYTDKHNINEFKPTKFKRKPWMQVIYKEKENRFNRYRWHEAYTSDPVEAKETSSFRLGRFTQSLNDRGPARPSKLYNPPLNVREKIFTIFHDLHSSSKTIQHSSQTDLANDDSILAVDLNQSRDLKFDMISRCIDVFSHDLSSALLNDMNTIADLIDYYSTPVQGLDPYSALVAKSDSLPPNLAILSEALRYDKENDQYFGGYNALPGSVGEIPGLRAKKKYPILNQDEFQWPDI